MEDPSYAHLAPWYDLLFPLDEDALSLAAALAGPPGGQSIVDAGCGSGLLAKALGRLGYRVLGFDLDPQLLDRALSPPVIPGVTFALGDLRTFALPPELPAPNLVTCLGNCLVHLTSPNDLMLFLRRAQNALSPAGRLLIQVLNYDVLIDQQRYDLPVREVGSVTLHRRYCPRPDGLWDFHTVVSTPEGQSTGTVPLRPWRRAELEAALDHAGFSVDAVWGGFDRRPLAGSLPLVISAQVP